MRCLFALFTLAFLPVAALAQQQRGEAQAIGQGQLRRVQEAMIVSWLVSRNCRRYGSTLHPGVLDTIERELDPALHDMRRQLTANFAEDNDRACQLAYDLYGPGGSMLSWASGIRKPYVQARPTRNFDDAFRGR